MSRATPAMLGWLQRALRHEFAAARQFTLQAVVARGRSPASAKVRRSRSYATPSASPRLLRRRALRLQTERSPLCRSGAV